MLLLGRDEVALVAPGQPDEYGWVQPGDPPPVWEGIGNLQLTAGPSSPRAAEQGGYGPYDPASRQMGVLFLPPEAPVKDGMVAEVRGQRFVLSAARVVMDPVSAHLDCWSIQATAVDEWPQ